jgi:hypothetical protein
VAFTFTGCAPPQLGEHEECFKEVDALYTAVTSKSPKLLEDCDRRLRELKEAGKLPEPAARSLDAVVAKARKGEWQPAAVDLHRFMKGQRRPRR